MRCFRLAYSFVLFLFLLGCVHTGVSGGSFVSEKYGFKANIPDESFKVVNTRGTVLTLINEENGTSIAVTVTDDKYIPDDEGNLLLYLARGLFIYIDNKEYLASEESEICGVPAWHMELSGEAEGVPLMFSAYVARKDGRIYDIVMWSSPNDFERAKEVLSDMIGSFEFLK
jgi:hypothetical protein